MSLPWFSEKDNDLLKGVSNRDPLGLIPIWTSVGRELIPNLASGVQRVEGVQTVALAYYLYSVLEVKKAFVEKWAFRRFFRVMEQICEKFMYDYLRDEQVEDGAAANQSRFGVTRSL